MTRELKLALIVGFAIVLTVAILVSDHLSKARQATLADVAGVNATRVAAKVPDEPIRSTDDLLLAALPVAMSVHQPALARSAEDHATLPPSTPDQGGPTLTQGLLANESDPAPAPLVIGLGSGSQQANLFTPVPDDATMTRRNVPTVATSEPVTPAQTAAANSPAGDLILQKVAEKQADSKPPARQPLPIGPNDRVHVIAANESLYAIARRYYGSGNLWRALAVANAGRVAEDGTARVGVRIVIPSKDVLLGKAPARRSSDPATQQPPAATRVAAQPSSKPSPTPAQATKTRTYTVKPGDSLGRIASRELGSARKIGEIAALNKMDPDDDLLAGAILKLPAR